jgi:hypothetical protein
MPAQYTSNMGVAFCEEHAKDARLRGVRTFPITPTEEPKEEPKEEVKEEE